MLNGADERYNEKKTYVRVDLANMDRLLAESVVPINLLRKDDISSD